MSGIEDTKISAQSAYVAGMRKSAEEEDVSTPNSTTMVSIFFEHMSMSVSF